MKLWLKFLIIILIVVGLINIVSLYNSYFSITYGKVVDSLGNGVPGAKVGIHYLCKNLFAIEIQYSILFIGPITITDNNGKFKFESYLGRPSILGCEKYIFTYKNGYCNKPFLCSNALSSEGIPEELMRGTEKNNYLYYKGRYYDPYYFQDSIKIGSKSKEVLLKLNRIEDINLSDKGPQEIQTSEE